MKMNLAKLYSLLAILLYAKVKRLPHMGIEHGPLSRESYIVATTLLY